MTNQKPFSIRQGVRKEPSPGLEEAPDALRYFVMKHLEKAHSGYADQAAAILEDFLHRPGLRTGFYNPYNPTNWKRMYELLRDFEWWQVYDFLEFMAVREEKNRWGNEQFINEVNAELEKENIPYRMNYDGAIAYRGSESFAASVATATEVLVSTGRLTAANEIHKAVEDLSKRRNPDLTGAVQHAMAALECVANDVCGEEGETLGDVIKRHQDKFPEPLGTAVSKLYGFASNRGRHLTEGQEPELKEVELVVGIAATVATYLSR